MDKPELKLTPFVMTKSQQERPRWADAPSYVRGRSKRARARSMWIKIGVCLSLLAAVVIFELTILAREKPSVAASATGGGADAGDDDVLGRLRFVQAGGVTSVFKVSQRWNAPVEATDTKKLEDGMVLALTAEADSRVSVPAAGEVTAIARDEQYGAYVRVSHGSELESIYYNLSDIAVEEGQPLSAQDTLGKVGADGCVYVRLRRSGAPVDPTEFIDAGNGG